MVMVKINRYEIIQNLAKELIQISKIKNQKYPFKEKYLEKLLSKYEKSKEVYKIYLKDLPGYCVLTFNDVGCDILNKILNEVKQKYGLDATKRKYGVNFYNLREYLDKSDNKQIGISIKTILSILNFLDEKSIKIDIKLLEKNIISIKMATSTNMLKIKGLPIKLNKKEWAIVFGSILDSWPKKFNVLVEDDDLRYDLIDGLISIGIIPSITKSGKHIKVNGHSVIGQILSISGININEKQIIANNPLPLWIFNKCDKEYHSMIIGKVLDTEGHSNKHKPHIRVAQSSLMKINKEEKRFILKNSKRTVIRPSGATSYVLLYSRLDEILKEKVLDNSSLILLSIQLLLRKYKINSIIYPINVYISSNGLCSISWHLSIIGLNNVKRFYENFKDYISIPYKKRNILESIKKNLRNHIDNNTSIAYYLLYASELEKMNSYFNIKEVTKICPKSKKTVYNKFGKLISQDYVRKIKKEGKFNLLKISEKGNNFLKEYPDFKEFRNLLY